MKKTRPAYKCISAMFALLLTFCNTTQGALADEQGFSMQGFIPQTIAPEAATNSRVINLFLPYIGGHPESMEGNSTLNLSIRKHKNRFLADLKMGGYLDDSVSGEHYRAIIVQAPGGWKMIELGVKLDCFRGISTGGKCL